MSVQTYQRRNASVAANVFSRFATPRMAHRRGRRLLADLDVGLPRRDHIPLRRWSGKGWYSPLRDSNGLRLMSRNKHSTEFETHGPRLRGLAYRMLGTRSDAEDIVQEAFLRWQAVPQESVASPAAFLTRLVTNLCIDELRSARRRREAYVGEWLPEPIETGPDGDAAYRSEQADSLSMAFLRLLEALSPRERAVFLLREVLGLDYEEVAEAAGCHRTCRCLVMGTVGRFTATRRFTNPTTNRQSDDQHPHLSTSRLRQMCKNLSGPPRLRSIRQN